MVVIQLSVVFSVSSFGTWTHIDSKWSTSRKRPSTARRPWNNSSFWVSSSTTSRRVLIVSTSTDMSRWTAQFSKYNELSKKIWQVSCKVQQKYNEHKAHLLAINYPTAFNLWLFNFNSCIIQILSITTTTSIVTLITFSTENMTLWTNVVVIMSTLKSGCSTIN